eukprot:jgi/Tetstr1/433047/TSEL_022382.t2
MRCACVVVRGGSAVRPLRPDGARRAPLLLRARGARTVHKRAARLPALAEGGGSGSAGGAPPEDGGNGDDGLSAKVREAKLKNVAAGRVRRRTSMRDAMNLALALRGEPKDEDKKEQNGEETEQEKKDKEAAAKEDMRTAVATTAFAVATGATVLRVGGRAALLSVAGLDFMQDSGLRDQVDQALTYADELGPWKVAAFAGAWCVTKVACLDALGVVLAVSSGILFGGVVQGGAASAACATLGSAVAFGLGRTVLRDRVAPEVEKRAALRAVERAVSNDGFKTVLTLRLAPLLPIPLGMYSYVYGASTALALPEFLGGTFVASLKPYTLDAYLGVFAKSVVDGDPGDNDAVLLATFAAVVLIGTLASQVATRTWEEVQDELKAEKAALAASGGGGDADGEEEEQEEDGFAWMGVFGQERDGGGPREWLVAAWGRLRETLELERAAAVHKLPPPPRVPRDWAERPVPAELEGAGPAEAEELYNEYLIEASVAWLVTLQGVAEFSNKRAPPPSRELAVEALRRALEEQRSAAVEAASERTARMRRR